MNIETITPEVAANSHMQRFLAGVADLSGEAATLHEVVHMDAEYRDLIGLDPTQTLVAQQACRTVMQFGLLKEIALADQGLIGKPYGVRVFFGTPKEIRDSRIIPRASRFWLPRWDLTLAFLGGAAFIFVCFLVGFFFT
jgi:hypothetical protein